MSNQKKENGQRKLVRELPSQQATETEAVEENAPRKPGDYKFNWVDAINRAVEAATHAMCAIPDPDDYTEIKPSNIHTVLAITPPTGFADWLAGGNNPWQKTDTAVQMTVPQGSTLAQERAYANALKESLNSELSENNYNNRVHSFVHRVEV